MMTGEDRDRACRLAACNVHPAAGLAQLKALFVDCSPPLRNHIEPNRPDRCERSSCVRLPMRTVFRLIPFHRRLRIGWYAIAAKD
ncbi:unnamed protein product [Stenotrophomonas maltophilia]|nr:unnamed protein product [Stenotrophomonas maltophilia]